MVFYTTAVEMDPACMVYLTNRAMAHLKLKNWDQAERDCDKAIEAEPRNLKAWWRRGSAKHGRIMYQQAIEGIFLLLLLLLFESALLYLN